MNGDREISHERGVQFLFVDEVLDANGGYAQGPERALMSALLFDGVMNYLSYLTKKGRSCGKRYREAYNWVHSDDSDYVFSFEGVCEGLGIDPKALRLGLINASNSSEEWKRSRRHDG